MHKEGVDAVEQLGVDSVGGVGRVVIGEFEEESSSVRGQGAEIVAGLDCIEEVMERRSLIRRLWLSRGVGRRRSECAA